MKYVISPLPGIQSSSAQFKTAQSCPTLTPNVSIHQDTVCVHYWYQLPKSTQNKAPLSWWCHLTVPSLLSSPPGSSTFHFNPLSKTAYLHWWCSGIEFSDSTSILPRASRSSSSRRSRYSRSRPQEAFQYHFKSTNFFNIHFLLVQFLQRSTVRIFTGKP